MDTQVDFFGQSLAHPILLAPTAYQKLVHLHGLAVGGSAGVERIIKILVDEFRTAMALCGKTRLSDIDCSVLWPEV